MAGASLDFDLSDIESRLSALQARLSNLTPLMEDIGSSLETSSSQRFESKTAPDGKRWPALAAATVRHRIRKGRDPRDMLQFSGDLRRSLNYRASADQVVISLGGAGNSTKYARAHQFGARINRVGVRVGGYVINIPARPVLGISRDDEAEISLIAEKFLGEDF